MMSVIHALEIQLSCLYRFARLSPAVCLVGIEMEFKRGVYGLVSEMSVTKCVITSTNDPKG
jgi:hypothetical protein